MGDFVGLGPLFFRLLNFAILVGFAFYFFRKKVYAHVVKNMTQRRAQARSRDERARELFEQAGRMRDTILQDKQFFMRMKEQIVQWGNAVEQHHTEQLKERDARAESVDARQQVRQQHLNQQDARRALLPGALGDATQELVKRFDNDAARRRYLATILTHMQRDT